MALYNRAWETTTSPGGTGTINLAGAKTGYQTFVDAGAGGATVSYVIVKRDDASIWEYGTGTITDAAPDTLSRTLRDSSTGFLLNLTNGDTYDVYCDAAAEDIQVPPSEGAFADGDKTKLDGIETAATADQTQADINALAITQTGTVTTGTWSSSFGDALIQDLADISGTSTGADEVIVSTGVGTFALESGTTLRTSLGVDAAGTDNSTNVTLAGTPDYLSLSGQQITLGQIDMTTDVTGALPVANGGTGATTLTDGGILLGSGTGAITAMAALADGSIVVGDGTTDPVALAAFSSSTGNLLAAKGGTIGQQTIWVPAAAMTARTTNGAAAGTAETTTHKVMLSTFDFDTSADEHVQFAIQMPKGWDESTIVAQAVWSHPSTATNFGVVWFIQAVAFANDDAADTAFGTAVSMTDTGGTTDDIYISPESSAMTVAGTPGAEEYVIFQVYRDVSDASDNLAVDARLHGIKLHYTIDAGTDD